MNVYGVLTGTLTSAQTLSGTLTITNTVEIRKYEGAYEFTPTEAHQTIEIENMMATQDITINPIPSNYGLITWDGISLTVS